MRDCLLFAGKRNIVHEIRNIIHEIRNVMHEIRNTILGEIQK